MESSESGPTMSSGSDTLLGKKRLKDDKVFKDTFFLVLFIANILVIVCLALSLGVEASQTRDSTSISVDASTKKQVVEEGNNDQSMFIASAVVILLLGASLAAAYVFLLSRFADSIVGLSLSSVLLVLLASGVSLLASGLVLGGVLLFATAAAVFAFYFFILRARVVFATVILKVACAAVVDLSGSLFAFGLAALGVLFVLGILWILCVLGAATNEANPTLTYQGHTYPVDECVSYTYSGTVPLNPSTTLTCQGSGSCTSCVCGGAAVVSNAPCYTPSILWGQLFGLLLSFYWTSATIANVVHCATANSVALWWADSSPTAASIRAGCRRACSTQLGSISFGSLLVAIVRTLRAFVYYSVEVVHKVDGRPGQTLRLYVISCLTSLLRGLDSLMSYFNRYAFVYVGMYGYSFLEASKEVMGLLGRHGIAVIVNDDIVDSILLLGQLLVGVVCMLVAYPLACSVGLAPANRALLTVFGFVAGFLMTSVSSRLLSAAAATVYVCWAEGHGPFELAHGGLHQQLATAWVLCHPTLPAFTIDDGDDEMGKASPSPQKGYSPPPVPTSASSADASGDVGASNGSWTWGALGRSFGQIYSAVPPPEAEETHGGSSSSGGNSAGAGNAKGARSGGFKLPGLWDTAPLAGKEEEEETVTF